MIIETENDFVSSFESHAPKWLDIKYDSTINRLVDNNGSVLTWDNLRSPLWGIPQQLSGSGIGFSYHL